MGTHRIDPAYRPVAVISESDVSQENNREEY